MPPFSATTNAEPLLDCARLRELEAHIGRKALGQLLNAMHDALSSIGPEFSCPDTPEAVSAVAANAHGLKGVAANFGCTRVVSLARAVERAAGGADAGALASAVAQLKLAVSATRIALRSWYVEDDINYQSNA